MPVRYCCTLLRLRKSRDKVFMNVDETPRRTTKIEASRERREYLGARMRALPSAQPMAVVISAGAPRNIISYAYMLA